MNQFRKPNPIGTFTYEWNRDKEGEESDVKY
jgi:hypothetical protein